jgi:hypothetical protein
MALSALDEFRALVAENPEVVGHPAAGQSVQVEPIEADPAPDAAAVRDAYEERAALVEFDAAVPRDWAEGFARLHVMPRPAGWSRRQWEDMLNDGGRFLDRHGAEAAALGWTAADLFGAHPAAQRARLDCLGLVPLISGGNVVKMWPDGAAIRLPSGVVQVWRRSRNAEASPVWTLTEGAAA